MRSYEEVGSHRLLYLLVLFLAELKKGEGFRCPKGLHLKNHISVKCQQFFQGVYPKILKSIEDQQLLRYLIPKITIKGYLKYFSGGELFKTFFV